MQRRNANGPPERAARHLITAAPIAAERGAADDRVTQDAVAELLERSDERDRYLARILAAWIEGYRAGELAHADDYERGVHDGRMLNKRAEHYVNDLFRLQVARYGVNSRPVLDPKPEDFPWLLRNDPRQGGAA